MNSNISTPVTEQELNAHAAVRGGQRVSLDDVETAIASVHYFSASEGCDGANLARIREQYPDSEATFIPLNKDTPVQITEAAPLSYLTICVLRMQNGFTVLGQSACADPAMYDREIGERLAYKDAVGKVWALMGYELKSRMAREQKMLAEAAVQTTANHTYIGTKVVNALPMNRADYNRLRGWELPKDERGEDEGYLVEYTDRVENPPHVEGFEGYVSWSPKEVFERAYVQVRPLAPFPDSSSSRRD